MEALFSERDRLRAELAKMAEIRAELDRIEGAIRVLQGGAIPFEGREGSQRGQIREMIRQAGNKGLRTSDIVKQFPAANRATAYSNLHSLKSTGEIEKRDNKYIWIGE